MSATERRRSRGNDTLNTFIGGENDFGLYFPGDFEKLITNA